MRTDIQSLVGGYVSLKRAGSNLRGLCPFHSEKSPSFTVYPADNSFYCFGCGAGGDQISFVMRAEHLDYPDAIKFLAKRAGINVIEDDNTHYDSGPKYDSKRLYEMNRDAAKFYNAYLFSEDPDAKAALSYFVDKRKLSLATIKHFGLGFAPNSFDKFSKYMLSRGYTYDELVVGFLCGKSEKGYYFDAFRNRVMFPIIDVSGNVIAFGGRVMDDSKPKYKNTSDTPVFKKSRNLFALNFAKNNCQDAIILCEGYMDVIALHSSGITNAVATLGTAITSEQARVMSRYTKKVIICYDADEAGKKAAARALKLLEEVGLDVSVLTVPGAKDPDEYIKTYGVDKFRDVIYGAKSKFDYNMETVLSRYDLSLPQDKINALNEIEKLISTVYYAAERDVYIHAVANKFNVEYSSIKADVDRMIARARAQYKKNEGKRIAQDAAGYSDRINPDFIRHPAVARNEETVLGLLLSYPEHRKFVLDTNTLTAEDFITDFNKRIFSFIMQSARDNGSAGLDFNLDFTPEEVGRIMRMKIARMELSANGDEVLRQCIDTLKKSVYKEKNKTTDTIDSLDDFLKNKRND